MSETPTEKALRISEARYRRLFEAAKDGILLLNAETGQIEDVNPFLIQMLGYSFEEFLGKKIWEIGAFKDTALNQMAFNELQQSHFIRYDNLPLVAKDGSQYSVEFVSNVYDCDGVQVIQCNIRDNTKRHLAEIALRAMTRALQMLSESNLANLSAATQITLLEEYCRIAVQTGGYRMAWIGFAGDDPGKQVQVVCFAGINEGYLEQAAITWAEEPRGNGPTGRALRSGAVQFTEDIAIDQMMTLWSAEALKRGYHAAISIPFKLPSGLMACLTLYDEKWNIWSAPERKLLQEIAADLAYGIAALETAISKIRYQVKLRESLEQTIMVVAATVEERDSYTAGHERRVAGICANIATELKLPPKQIHGLRLAAVIHDLGKIGIPAEILAMPRPLTVMEFGLIKQHPLAAYNILRNVDFPWPIADIILQHHERIDGSGYPKGLKGNELLIESKILAVADVVEAMATHRPYRPALGIDAALAEVEAQSGKTLDAAVVAACIRVFRERGYEIED